MHAQAGYGLDAQSALRLFEERGAAAAVTSPRERRELYEAWRFVHSAASQASVPGAPPLLCGFAQLLADSAPAVGKPIQTHEAALSDVQVSPAHLTGCSFAPRCAYASDRCHGEPPALEAATPHAPSSESRREWR